MSDPLFISYRYEFPDGRELEFPLEISREDLSLCAVPAENPPDWTALAFHRCPVCRLDPDLVSHCPVAVNLCQITEAFRDYFAHESVEVTVATRERTYVKSVSVQEGLSSLIGIVMVTSGCPSMERLKPMVRFHLPFASIEESSYRVLAMYLVAQFYHHRRGEWADWRLTGLNALYADVSAVNESFARRLLTGVSKDASVNAMVNLDCLAKLAPATVTELLEEMEEYFRTGFFSL